MTIETKKMFKPDGKQVQLVDWLNEIGTNNFDWSILDFYGTGQAPNDLSMEEFESAIRLEETGFKMNWRELMQFAESLDQTIECVIVALEPGAFFIDEKLGKDDFSSCKIVIQAFDSTEWRIQKN